MGCAPEIGEEPGVEPFGIVFVEAMLQGLPCIGTSRFAMPEIIADGETGWLVAEDDVQSLSHRLITALTNRDASFAMGQRGRARALDLFTWDRVAGRIVRGMEEELQRRTAETEGGNRP